MSDRLGNDGLPVRGNGIWAKEKMKHAREIGHVIGIGKPLPVLA
jgi:hypothetical protein